METALRGRPTMPKLRLGINIDHVATLRNARNRDAGAAPDVFRAAQEAIKGGADGITIHLREDRRHILDEDAMLLCAKSPKPVNLEMAATKKVAKIALALRPHAVCIVPERRQEVTTEGGLDAERGGRKLAGIVNRLAASGIRVSLFIAPDAQQVLAAWTAGAAAVEFHTGAYAHAKGAAKTKELKRLRWAAKQAHKLGLEVHAGHGLTYDNVGPVAAIPEIVELNIGHFLVGEALFIGLTAAVREMRRRMKAARRE
jgi:pyridoxine 5-phosphate synthase